MKKLALSEDILLKVDKPARYIGGEYNEVVKEGFPIDRGERTEKDIVRYAMVFPDVYEIGMSHLGMQILYALFNKRPDIWCERVFSPWTDLHPIMKEKKIPLFGLESQEPIKDFDFVGITIQYEMCYSNIVQILDLAQIPVLSCERTESDPLVIGGGPCTYNPEPIADFFDLFYMGEGEVNNLALVDLYKECRKEGVSRQEFLRKAAQIDGIYVPSLYNVTYNEDGTIQSFSPKYEDVPATVNKVIVSDMTQADYIEKPIVPFIKCTQDRAVLEIMRGCIRGCRFCQAGMVYRPRRERDVNDMLDRAKMILKNSGHEELSLSSLSSSDYTGLDTLLNGLIEECDNRHVNLSLPSLRIDQFSLDVMKKIQDVKKSSITFAPEAGTQRMRNVINKGLTEEEILNGARQAFRGGWTKIKLYFMLGLPMETEEDQKAIADLANEIAGVYFDTVPKAERKGTVSITISTSFFIPKPFTPFQWAPMFEMNEYIDKAQTVKKTVRSELNQKRLSYQYHSPEESVMEGVFARGDRRIARVIKQAYEEGSIYDAWSENFDYDKWMRIMDENGLDYHFYTTRARSTDEILPWDFINAGVSKKFLIREWELAQQAVVTPNCAAKCAGCSANKMAKEACAGARNLGNIPEVSKAACDAKVQYDLDVEAEKAKITAAGFEYKPSMFGSAYYETRLEYLKNEKAAAESAQAESDSAKKGGSV